jgi:hypothetical protein
LSVTVKVTLVTPTEYGPGGAWLRVISSSWSGSKEPLFMDAAAVPLGPAGTVTFRQIATGTSFLRARASGVNDGKDFPLGQGAIEELHLVDQTLEVEIPAVAARPASRRVSGADLILIARSISGLDEWC